MKLKYALIQNLLNQTGQADDYTARPVEVESHDMDAIIAEMLAKGSTVTRTDILAVLNSFFEVCATITQNGEAINTDLFKTNFSITGTFAAATDHFDKAKQKLHLNLHSGKTLDEALAKVLLEKTSVSQQLPEILEVLDSTSGSVNDQITPGGAIKIAGSRLKVEGTEAGVGVFINSTDGVKVNKVATLIENKPSLLIVQVPAAITAGQYNLIVSTQYGGRSGNLLNTPRSTTFNRTLTVA